MNSEPLLSICIPTYKMSSFLRELLASIEASIDGTEERVEIVVCDNASPDDTGMVVDEFRGRLKRLVYRRHANNQGPDRNFLAVVEAASGRWCWLMGSDDIVEKGSIVKLLNVLDGMSDCCGLSLNRYARSFDLVKITPEDAFPDFPETTRLHGGEQVFGSLAYYLGYLSGQVVHRKTWQEVVQTRPVERYFNAYIHVYIIGEMLKIRPTWVVLRDRLVGWRSGNDSFMHSGRLKRLEIDVVGYEKIAIGLFGLHSATFKAMRDMIATKHLRHHIIAAVIEGNWRSATRTATRRLALHYYFRSWPFWRQTAPLLFAPAPLLRIVHAMRRAIR